MLSQQTHPTQREGLITFFAVGRTLSTSDDVEDRETEKGRLEEAYEKCDRDLDELIVQHYTELTTAIRTYQSITERITNSRNKIKQVKENLLSCKMLLHCKRDELRKLWIEGIEHKHVLNLLDEIENIKQVPQKLQQCMASKHYLTATDMLSINLFGFRESSADFDPVSLTSIPVLSLLVYGFPYQRFLLLPFIAFSELFDSARSPVCVPVISLSDCCSLLSALVTSLLIIQDASSVPTAVSASLLSLR
ncbi:UNVERIFIED_CONTAM: hypothetical protein K2H54_076914 [Gekko kuhli]